MKKLLSIVLSLAMIFSITTTAFATNTTYQNTDTAIVNISGGNLYTATTSNKNIAILTNDATHLLDVSISYPSAPNTVYQWTITD